jgi:hypothetical protein
MNQKSKEERIESIYGEPELYNLFRLTLNTDEEKFLQRRDKNI